MTLNKSQADKLIKIAKEMLEKAKALPQEAHAAGLAAGKEAMKPRQPLSPEVIEAAKAAMRQRVTPPKSTPMTPASPAAPAQQSPMSLHDFHNELDRHDWYHDYSDSRQVSDKGKANLQRLKGIAQQSPEHQKMLNDYHQHMFTGDPWKTPRAPKPQKPLK